MGRRGADELVGSISQQGVLTGGRLGVISPPGRRLGLVGKVVGREVLPRTVLSSPSLTERVDHEIADIEITVGLMTDQGSASHGDKRPIPLGPARPHRSPSVTLVVEITIEREVGPPSALERGVVPEHAPRLGSVGVVPLVQGVPGLLESVGPEEERVGGGGKLVGTVVTPVELVSHALVVHVEQARQVPLRSGFEQSLIVAVGSDKGRDHLGGTGGSKVPVIRSLGPGPVISDGNHTGSLGVVGNVSEDGLGGPGGVVSEDGEGSHGHPSVTDTVPVSGDGIRSTSGPPGVDDGAIGGTVVHALTKAETKVDDPASDLSPLLVGPDRVEPVVSDTVSRGEFGNV